MVERRKPGDPLTKRQLEVYDFIVQEIRKGLPPSVREIMEQFGFRSPNGTMCHLDAIEEKGYITRRKETARAIFLTDLEPQPKSELIEN